MQASPEDALKAGEGIAGARAQWGHVNWRTLQAGFDLHLPKPVADATLRQVLAERRA